VVDERGAIVYNCRFGWLTVVLADIVVFMRTLSSLAQTVYGECVFMEQKLRRKPKRHFASGRFVLLCGELRTLGGSKGRRRNDSGDCGEISKNSVGHAVEMVKNTNICPTSGITSS
jgi:hypothetical protein